MTLVPRPRPAAFFVVVVSAFVWFTAVLAVAPAMAQSTTKEPIIREVRVQGIERIEPATVRSYIQLRAGERYDPKKVNESLKSLFATGLFSDVSIGLKGDVVIVKVTENPIINRVAFEGNDVISTETLRQEVHLRPRVVYTRTRVQDDVKRIQNLYQRQGRFAAQVKPEVIEKSQNRVDVVFEITEGPPTKIRKITFIGNKAYSDSRLRSVIGSAEHTWYSFLTGDDVYDPDRMAFDQELLRRYYLAHGYPEFSVRSATAELSPDRSSFYLTYTIHEGPRYKFGKITIHSQLKKLAVKNLYKDVTFEKGDTYNANEVENTVNKLTDAVGTLGYAFVDVRPVPKRDRKKRLVNMDFEIREGPHTFVQRIEISGNVRTEDRVIRREFRLVEGDAFNAAKYRLSQQRIRDLGFFKKVTFNQVPGSAPDQTVIQVKVQEQSTGSASVGAGFSSTEGLLTQFSLSERNLLGTGQKLSLSASLGTKSQQYNISFTDPYFLERNMSAGFDLFNTRLLKTGSIAFEQDRTGFGLRAGFRYNDRLSQGLNYKLERKKVSNVDTNASLFVKREEGTALTSLVGQTLTYDTRDSKIDPTEGYIVSVSNDLAGLGGTNRYLRNKISGDTYYQGVFDWVLHFGGEAGYIIPLGKPVRIDDRYFIGGDSLLGFANGGIGPRDAATGDALGGLKYVTGTAEAAIPLGVSTTYKPRGFIFTDMGTLTDPNESGTGIEKSSLLRIAVGIGFGVATPFGNIRVNLTKALRKASFDKPEIFSFRIGAGF